MDLFEKASKQKFRFLSTTGSLTVEDLWDLPLTSTKSASLDQVGVQLVKYLENTSVSLVAAPSKDDQVAKDKLEIVKHIIAYKQEQAAKVKETADKAQKRNLLQQALFDAQNRDLASKTPEEIQALLKELE